MRKGVKMKTRFWSGRIELSVNKMEKTACCMANG